MATQSLTSLGYCGKFREGCKTWAGPIRAGGQNVHSGTFVEVIRGKTFIFLCDRSWDISLEALTSCLHLRSYLRVSHSKGKKKTDAGILMIPFELLDAAMFETSCMHELFSYMLLSVSFWFSVMSVVLRLTT